MQPHQFLIGRELLDHIAKGINFHKPDGTAHAAQSARAHDTCVRAVIGWFYFINIQGIQIFLLS
jgi:hypothetical protein